MLAFERKISRRGHRGYVIYTPRGYESIVEGFVRVKGTLYTYRNKN